MLFGGRPQQPQYRQQQARPTPPNRVR